MGNLDKVYMELFIPFLQVFLRSRIISKKIKIVCSGAWLPRFKSWLCNSLGMWKWATLTSLCPHVLVCEEGQYSTTSCYCKEQNDNEIIHIKNLLEQCLTNKKHSNYCYYSFLNSILIPPLLLAHHSLRPCQLWAGGWGHNGESQGFSFLASSFIDPQRGLPVPRLAHRLTNCPTAIRERLYMWLSAHPTLGSRWLS